MGREVILDNSIFELGKAFEMEAFANWVKIIKPTYYIVPDSLENTKETIKMFEQWKKKHSDIKGKKIGVVHGKNFKQLVECYKYMCDNTDIIAIGFNYSYYNKVGIGNTKYARWMHGRITFIEELIKKDIYNKNVPIHLLGTALPQEFEVYKNKNINIHSIDTSSPILHGMYGIRYKDNGLETKCTIKMADVFESKVSDECKDIIYYNIKKFKSFVR
jgi:hypothetical protein